MDEGRAELSVKALDGELKARELAKAVAKSLDSKDPKLDRWRSALVLLGDAYDNYKEWREVRDKFRVAKQIEGSTRIVAADVKKFFERRRWISYLSDKALNKDTIDLVKFSEDERAAFFKAGMVKERTRLEKIVGPELAKGTKKVLGAAEVVLKGYDVAVAAAGVLDSLKNLQTATENYAELASNVDKELGGVPCKEAIGNMERLRQLTIAAALKVDEDEGKALMAALDLALSVATTFVGGPLLAAVTVVRGTYELVCAAGDWIDRELLHGFVASIYARWDQVNRLINASDCNQRLLRERSDHPTEVQFRLRAEAITGLVGLFTRASVASKDEQEYLDRIKKYRVEEYIKTYLLSDGWQIPLRMAVPISMDAYWLYAAGKYLPLGFDPRRATQFRTATQVATVPGGFVFMAFVDAVLAGHVRASFQETFPIHHLESSTTELALALRTYWGEVTNEQIEYTCVYYRNFASTDETEWKPVNSLDARKVDDLQRLTPLNPIRVLIVMNQTVKKGIYPVSLQVVRTDPWVNILGPIYRSTLRPLAEDDLLADEKKFKGRMGCVVYPFYQFGDKVFPGLKPLNRLLLKEPDLFMHGLRDMRYSLAVRVGSDPSDLWVTLGGPQCRTSELDEVRIGFANTTVEQCQRNAKLIHPRGGHTDPPEPDHPSTTESFPALLSEVRLRVARVR